MLLVTQNVDGLHRRAGSLRMVELHGSIWRVRCLEEGKSRENREVPLRSIPPHCPCGGLLRPDVVWFGEALSRDALDRADDVAQHCDVMLVIGTSGVVQPAARLPGWARQMGALVIEVNPEATPITDIAQIFLKGPSGTVLPQLVSQAREIRAQLSRTP